MKTGEWPFDYGCLIRQLAFCALVIGSSVIAFSLYQLPYDDLPSFYWATRLVFDNVISPYQPEYFQAVGEQLDRKIYPFLYPPPSLIIFSPFLLVDYSQAKIIFSLLNLALWWLLAWFLYRFYCALKSVEHDTMAAVVIFVSLTVFAPLIDTIRTGQINLVVMACLIPFMHNRQKNSAQFCAGALLAVAVMFKVYLLLLLPLTIVFQAWRTLCSALVTMILLCIVSYLCMPANIWSDWIALSQQGAGYGKLMPHVMTLPWNQSLNGFLLRLVSRHDLTGGLSYWPTILYVVAITLAISVYWTAAACRTKLTCGLAMAVAMVLALVNVIAPLTWLHHFVFMAPAAVGAIYLSKSRFWLKTVLLVATAAIGVPALTNGLFGLPAPWPTSGQVVFVDNLAMSLPLVSGICILLSLMWLIRKGPVPN